MNRTPIYLSPYDHRRLREIVAAGDDSPCFQELRRELERAIIVPPHARVPTFVVTPGSKVVIQDQETDEMETCVVTLPGQSVSRGTAVSVITPLGIALLGCAQGDLITYREGDRTRALKIVRVVQSTVAEATAALAVT